MYWKLGFKLDSTYDLLWLGNNSYICFEKSFDDNVKIYYLDSHYIMSNELMEYLTLFKDKMKFFFLPSELTGDLIINDYITIRETKSDISRSVYAVIEGCNIQERVWGTGELIKERKGEAILYHLFTSYYDSVKNDGRVLTERLEAQKQLIACKNSLRYWQGREIALEEEEKVSLGEVKQKIEDLKNTIKHFEKVVDRLEGVEFDDYY